MFRNLYGLNYVILRPSVPYGPRQNPLGRQGAAVVFLNQILKGYPINIWGDGSTTRDYFYISDLTDALIISATKELSNHFVFNIGGGEEISLNQLIHTIETVTGEKAKIVYNQVRNFDAPRISLDTRLAQQELDWHPKVTLIEGIQETYSWVLSII